MYNDEKHIQEAVINFLRIKYPDVLFTIAPAGVRRGSKLQRIIAGREAKRMGYRKGCPDVLIFEPRGRYHGLAVELKTERGKPDSEGNQKRWISDLCDRKYYADFCYGYDHAIKTIEAYLKHGGADGRT